MNIEYMIENILKFPGFWSANGPNSDVALSTRIRLARNIQNIPFPNQLYDDDFKTQRKIISNFINNSSYQNKISEIDLNDLSNYDKRFLRERNIITDEMESSTRSLVLNNNEGDFSILINEEDHIRIQVIKPGLQLFDAYRLADSVDDELNKFVDYAFSEEFGYLSACPSNLGTGLRVSVLLHLPVISMQKKMNEITASLRGKGAQIKGTIGNGLRTIGNIYQVTNQGTLGNSEIDIIESMDSIINTILIIEDTERDNFIAKNRIQLEDIIWRSYGILSYSKKINYVEAMDHLSNIRLGVVLAVIKDFTVNQVNDMMVNIQWSHLQRFFDKIITTSVECDEMRSNYIKLMLNNDKTKKIM